MIPARNFLDQTVASPAKSVEMRARGGERDRCFMMVYGESIWLVLRGAGSGWVRLGASRFWNACKIRFKFKYNDVGKSVDVILIEGCNFGSFGD